MNYLTTDTDLTAVANAIRAKTGESGQLEFPADFVSEIGELSKPAGTKSISANGTGIDVAQYALADVSVPNSYSQSDEGKVVSNGALVAQTSDTVTQNGTVDTTLINSLNVNVSGGGGSVAMRKITIINARSHATAGYAYVTLQSFEVYNGLLLFHQHKILMGDTSDIYVPYGRLEDPYRETHSIYEFCAITNKNCNAPVFSNDVIVRGHAVFGNVRYTTGYIPDNSGEGDLTITVS